MKSVWFIIQNTEALILKSDNSLPEESDITSLRKFFLRESELGTSQDCRYFCAELPSLDSLPNKFQALNLRRALVLLGEDKFNLAVKACSLLSWDKNHQYCGSCGKATVLKTKLLERICPVCKLSFFPRISPAVIVLIYKEKQILMARSYHFLPGVYGLISGFVEIGENLEQAVHREIQEEVGFKVKNVKYFGSQPWPFPDLLLLGFTAEYDSGDLIIDKTEIEDAGWYSYDNLPGRPSSSISIASVMIDWFLSVYS